MFSLTIEKVKRTEWEEKYEGNLESRKWKNWWEGKKFCDENKEWEKKKKNDSSESRNQWRWLKYGIWRFQKGPFLIVADVDYVEREEFIYLFLKKGRW